MFITKLRVAFPYNRIRININICIHYKLTAEWRIHYTTTTKIPEKKTRVKQLRAKSSMDNVIEWWWGTKTIEALDGIEHLRYQTATTNLRPYKRVKNTVRLFHVIYNVLNTHTYIWGKYWKLYSYFEYTRCVQKVPGLYFRQLQTLS